MSRPPTPVFQAVLLISLSFSLGFITWTITAHWQNPVVPFIFLLILAAVFLFIRAIYRGRNWARWVFAVFTVMGLLGSASALHHFSLLIEKTRYIVQCICSIIAIILLFLPQSNPWFSKIGDED